MPNGDPLLSQLARERERQAQAVQQALGEVGRQEQRGLTAASRGRVESGREIRGVGERFGRDVRSLADLAIRSNIPGITGSLTGQLAAPVNRNLALQRAAFFRATPLLRQGFFEQGQRQRTGARGIQADLAAQIAQQVAERQAAIEETMQQRAFQQEQGALDRALSRSLARI